MITSNTALAISREILLAVVNDIDKNLIAIGDEPNETFTLMSKLDIEQTGNEPGQAILFLALLEDARKADDLKSILSKLIDKL